jgi:RimJ/RimL family protein N-acetyltransferase
MTEALVAFSKWAFETFEKLLRLQAEVFVRPRPWDLAALVGL